MNNILQVICFLVTFFRRKCKICNNKPIKKYYNRFGFTSIVNFGIIDTGDIPTQYTMGLELEKGFLGTKGGTISIC